MEYWGLRKEDFEEHVPRMLETGRGKYRQVLNYQCFQTNTTYRPAVLINTGITRVDWSEKEALKVVVEVEAADKTV